MANPFFVWGAYVQFGRDATWGTFPTITKAIPVYNYTVKSLGARLRPNLLTGSIAQPDLVVGMDACQLEMSLPVTYPDLMLIWDAIMGTATYGSNGGSSAGSLPYTHTWAGFLNLMNSLSFELVDQPSSKCVRAIGMKVQKATLKCSAGLDVDDQIMRMDLTMIGYSMTENQSPTGSLSQSTFTPVLQKHCTVQTDIGNTVTTASTLDWELVIDTGVKERPFLEGLGNIGEPQRSMRPQWTLTMDREYQSRTLDQQFLANGGQLVTTTYSISSSYVLTFSNFFGKMETYPERPIDGSSGWARQKVVLTGQGDYANGNTRTLDLALTNLQATITT